MSTFARKHYIERCVVGCVIQNTEEGALRSRSLYVLILAQILSC